MMTKAYYALFSILSEQLVSNTKPPTESLFAAATFFNFLGPTVTDLISRERMWWMTDVLVYFEKKK
jgi:hypothetical protein